jgi:hypothetical protein
MNTAEKLEKDRIRAISGNENYIINAPPEKKGFYPYNEKIRRAVELNSILIRVDSQLLSSVFSRAGTRKQNEIPRKILPVSC